jgi:CRP-like cAMP-binding protein/anti-anti-sigma regulatory factor
MVTAWGMLDRWSGGLIKKLASASQSRKEIGLNLALVGLVTVVTVVLDLMVAVAIGLVLSSLHFVVKSGETGVRGIYTGESVSSRRVYPHSAREVLERHGHETVIVALQGALFFGSADRFRRTLEGSLTEQTRRVILDLHRVTAIDSSGGLAIVHLQDSLSQSGRMLAIAGLVQNSAQWSFLRDLGIVDAVKPEYFFPDIDRALEWSEMRLLESHGTLEGSYLERDLGALSLFREFSPQELEVLKGHLRLVELQPGEHLFRNDDLADSIVIVTAGALELCAGEPSASGHRLAHFGPGSTVGEVSLFQGNPKTSNAVADLPFKGYYLSRNELERLQTEQPQICSRLLLALGRELAQRVQVLRAEVLKLND